MKKLLVLLGFLALGYNPALAQTKSIQLSQDPRGPITIDASNNVTFPAGVTIPSTATFNGAVAATLGLTASDMVVSTAGLPTIASGACGATTNGAVVAGSTNQTGNITIGSATTTTCTVSFSKTLSVAPNTCVIQPTNATAAAVGTTVAYVSAITTGHFVITGSALASANYSYICW